MGTVFSNIKRGGFIVFLLSLFVSFSAPTNSFAADTEDDKVVEIMCNIINYVTGKLGKSVAIIVMISVAIMLFLGKLSWGLGIAIAVGMGLMFGAPKIVSIITEGGDSADLCLKKSNQ